MNRNFKLQKVLEFRERKLDIEKEKLEAIDLKFKEINIDIEKVITEIENKSSELKQFLEACDFKFIKMYELYIEKLEKRLIELKNLRKKLELEQEKQKKAVLNALNDVKVMENLKEKHIKNYIMYLNKEERKMIDELVVTRFKNE